VAGLFVFEGPDDVGKTTIIKEVEKRLHMAGQAYACLSFPGKEQGTLGAHVYKLHHELAYYDVTQLSPLSLQLLHVAAHIDTIEQRILPLIREGKTILLDRYWWSTWAYGIAAKVPAPQLDAIIAIEKLVWLGVVPASLFLLSRQQSLAPHTLVDAYKDLVRQESDNYPVIAIKNEDTVDSIADEITRRVLAAS
jgi:thymidylate kinase